MKREFPVLFEKVSVWIVVPLVYFWTLIYIQQAISKPAIELYAIGMSAFGVTAGLSGVCFAMAAAPHSILSASTYAGEKFLHSSILLIQTLLIISVRDSVLQWEFLQRHSLVGIIKGIAVILLFYVAGAAVITWHHGFSELNAALWKKWERNIREYNDPVKAAPPKKGPDERQPNEPLETDTKGQHGSSV